MVKGEFESLPLRPSAEVLPDDVECCSNQRRRHGTRSLSSPRIYSSLHWAIHAICLITLATLWYAAYSTSQDRDGDCSLKHNVWSPLLFLDDTLNTRRFVGTFKAMTPTKGPPNDQVNEAWSELWDVNTVNLTAEDMAGLNRSLDSVQYPPEVRGGYMAQVEAVHQIHCLHFIWRDHHLAFFPEDKAKKDRAPEYYEAHYEHCVDALKQRLICTADPGMVTFRWVEGHRGPEPDFNTDHKCRDYESLLEWNRDNVASVEVNDIRWEVPPDAVKLSVPP